MEKLKQKPSSRLEVLRKQTKYFNAGIYHHSLRHDHHLATASSQKLLYYLFRINICSLFNQYIFKVVSHLAELHRTCYRVTFISKFYSTSCHF